MKKSLDDSIKQFLVLQLYKEYEHILYSYKIKMRKPLIQIKENTSHYGSWCEKTRTLTLACKLVEKYPWTYTLAILKHEMAHQYVNEVLKGEDSHGLCFKKACHHLRVEAWAQKSCLNLDDCLEAISQNKNSLSKNKPLRLIKKLLNLAHSSNQHEAFEALKKASEIAKYYQLDLNTTEEETLRKLTVSLKKQKTHTYESLIASILNAHFNVTVIHSSLFNPDKLKEEKTLEILGEEHSVEMAEYIFYFLSRKLKTLWEEHQLEHKSCGIKTKNAFFFGVLDGYLEQLNKKEKFSLSSDREEKSALLLRQKENTLKVFTNYQFPRTSQTKSKNYVVGSKGYSEGLEKGLKLKVREPLKHAVIKRLQGNPL